jgi:hypothetical protein
MAPNKGAAPNAVHPDSRADEEWFENDDGTPGWYKRPQIGVTDLRNKWDPIQNGFALGGGVTIGTVADNGFTFSGSLLLVISFPGPIILLEGKANLLKERSSLTDDPLFRVLVVLDFRAGNFLVGLMAQYKFGDGGELIDIAGSAEAFFDFNDPSRWHLYLGVKDPKSRRIRAQILTIFEANAYFMLDASRLQMGAWVGYDKEWSFGPLSVVVEAWIEGGAVLNFKPPHFHGDLWLHGRAELRVFGFGLGLHVDARVAADVFDPFHVLAEFSVGINLPWPLPDFDVDITLEWGPTPDEPPLPLPLKEIAVEHFKSTASWPLPRTQLLLPNTDDGNGFVRLPVPAADLVAGPPADAPVVPLDSRPHITFGRAVHDRALVGVNPQPVWPSGSPAGWERIGDPENHQGPMRVRFSLNEITIAQWNGATWTDLARKATTANPTGVRELYGSWAPIPLLPAGTAAPGTDPPVAQVKLWLWSKTPFDYSQHGGRAWDEWFTDNFTNYPCIPPVPERTICCDFDNVPVGSIITLPMPCRTHPELVFVGNVAGTIEQLPSSSHGHTHALCWDSLRRNQPTPVTGVREVLSSRAAAASRVASFGITLTGDPARLITLVFAREDRGTVRRCFDLKGIDEAVVRFPLTKDRTTVRIFDRNGKEIDEEKIVTIAGGPGFNIGQSAQILLPCAALRVDVTVSQHAKPVTVSGYDRRGRVVAIAQAPNQRGRVTVSLEGRGINSIVIDAPQNETWLLEVCADCPTADTPDVQVIAIDTNGNSSGPYLPVGDTVTVAVANIRAVVVYSNGHVCLVEVCATFPPSADEVADREDMRRRLTDSMAFWGAEGDVLKPNASYRLKVVTSVEAIGEGPLAGVSHTYDITEVGYFKTQGPPALTTLTPPVHQPPGEAFDSGLDDLHRYVRQTVPPTVPARGQQPLLPRPVYRAYDVGVEFNENYVDLMYRLAQRDLNIYLFDVNNQPVRDVAGRVIVSANRWGVTDSVLLTEGEMRYLSVIDQADCVAADPAIIPHQQTLFAIDPGIVLEPDIVHEARLVPLLIHEDFRNGPGAWTVVDVGTNQTPSVWTTLGHPTLEGTGATAAGVVLTLAGAGDLARVDPATDVVILSTDTARPSKTYRIVAVDNVAKTATLDGVPALSTGSSAWRIPGWGAVVQTSNIWGGDDSASAVAKPGTLLVTQAPGWNDYRFTVQIRSSDNDAIGVVFRYQGPGDHYRFSLDSQRAYRRLVRVAGGSFTVLAEDDFVYTSDQDYVITVEAIGSSIRVYQDGAPVFDVVDSVFNNGGVGLYCWASEGARFSDVRVDDLGQNAPIAYRFSFTTSNFADFFHHLHSFNDDSWTTAAADGNVAAEIAAAVAPATAVSDAEMRAYTSFATKVLGSAAQNAVKSVEAHRVTVADAGIGLLVRSPEPIDWRRAALELLFAPGLIDAPAVPGIAKLTDVSPGGASPNDESVTILARDRTSFARASIEMYDIQRPLVDTNEAVLLDDTFDYSGGVLLEQEFGANALDRFEIVDAAGAVAGPSQWSVSAGAIVQSSNIMSGSLFGTDPARLGTMAITGGRWANIRMTVSLRSGDDDAIGVVFRYTDNQHWYRFSMDRQRPGRRLVKCVDGTITVLWEDQVVYDISRRYEIRIDAYRDLLVGYIDNELLFLVQDADVREGQVGFYAWANIDARFEALRVESLETSPILFTAPFQDLAELTIIDTGTAGGPSVWTLNAGVLAQTSNIGSDEPPVGIARPGTVALLERAFSDFQLSVGLTSTGSAIGVVFRYEDDNNWYRFSMDRQLAYRRLVRCVAGVHTVLWQDAVAYPAGKHELTITAEGSRLRASLDGGLLFDVRDDALKAGRVGLYSWANVTAQFERVVITDPVRRIGNWEIVDGAITAAPSIWRTSNGSLRQESAIGEPTLPAAAGTLALARQTAWTDYRVEARLRSDASGAIGIVFRHRDAANWYRLSLEARRSYRRLVKCVAGVVTVLWQDSDSYRSGSPFVITIEAIGQRLVGYQDDELLFDIVDADHPNGVVGLYCSENAGARFERVTVTLPPRDSYAIFRDRFNAGDLAPWTIVDEGPQSAPSAWAIANGTLRQTSNIHSLPLDAAAIEKRGTQAVAGDVAWTDTVLSVRLRSTDDDAIGVLFRYQNANNFYRFSMDRERGYRRVVRSVAGVFTTLWEDDTRFEVGRSYDLIISAIGARINIWIDGVPLAEIDDATINNGRIGLYCWGNQGAEFSSLRVFTPDRLAPDTLLSEDFAVEIPQRWTTVTSGTQLPPAAWTIAGGELRQTSNVWGGSVLRAELLKPGTAAIFTQPAGLGATGMVPGSESWTDYRVTVRLRSDDDDAIGVLVRYTDEDNWYRFSMDRERAYRRLIKCAAGVVTELWSDAVAYVVGREYLVTIDVIDDAIVGYLDGVPLFSVRDNAHPAGTLGLYCWANTGARFSSVRVTSAAWSTYYRFSIDEELLAAGTRVAVRSGNSADWTQAPTPGLKHRFAASTLEAGRFQIPTNRPVDFRWRNSVGELGHGRRFLPASSYTATAGFRILRKADGTEAAIFVPVADDPGSAIQDGQYRLQFTYRRDNTALDADSPVLSRGGDTADEEVRIDIPYTG